MELASKSLSGGSSGAKTRQLLIAGAAALVAAVLVVVALNAAKTSSTAAGTTSVVVARQLIPKGSSATAIAGDRAFRTTDVRGDAVVTGPITDISMIRGKVAVEDIYPGQQLSTKDFVTGRGTLTARLGTGERAIALPIDQAHGLVGQVSAGDRVDVLAGFNLDSTTGGGQRPVMRALASNVVVLKAPKSGGSSTSSNNAVVTLRVKDDVATKLAFSADNGKIWLALRGGGDSRTARPDVITIRNLLFGTKTVDGE